MRDDLGLQVDFLAVVHGISSFEALRSRSTEVTFGGARLRVASLDDIIKSKRAADRPRDRAVLPILIATSHEASQKENEPKKRAGRPRKRE